MLLPLPPWCFPNARVLHQPSLIPADAARAVIPSLVVKTRKQKGTGAGSSGDTRINNFVPTLRAKPEAAAVATDDADEVEERLRLVSLWGWTMGGLFIVDWLESSIGPYREVAVLAGVVVREQNWWDGIGAWACHIVVTTDAAV